jgi:hypothetical protein
MIAALAIAALASIPLLALVTFVQLLYLESLRLRPRDLPSLEFFKATLEDKLGLKTEDGAGAFSLIKHTLLALLGVFYLAWFVDGDTGSWTHIWQSALAAWLTMAVASYAVPQLLYRRTRAQWLVPLTPWPGPPARAWPRSGSSNRSSSSPTPAPPRKRPPLPPKTSRLLSPPGRKKGSSENRTAS